jgi:hypothetical protein
MSSFRVHKSAAPLKRRVFGHEVTGNVFFPRSYERGPVEGGSCYTSRPPCLGFRVRRNAAPLKHAFDCIPDDHLVTFRVFTNATPLKHVTAVVKVRISNRLPRP